MGCHCCNDTKTFSSVAEIEHDALVCFCEGVTKGEMVKAIESGAKTVKDVVNATGACKTASLCEELNPNKRCCAIDIMELIKIMQKS